MAMKNDLALTPDDKPPRIIRFIDGPPPAKNLLSVLHPTTNVLHVYRQPYDSLSDLQKNRVQRTHAITIHLHDHKLVEGEYGFQRIPSIAAE